MRKGPLFALLGRRAKANGQFDSPRGVAIDKEGNYFVSSSHCVQVFDSAGNFVRKFGSEGTENGEMNIHVGVGILSTGNVVVGDYWNDRCQTFDQQGNFVCVLEWEFCPTLGMCLWTRMTTSWWEAMERFMSSNQMEHISKSLEMV